MARLTPKTIDGVPNNHIKRLPYIKNIRRAVFVVVCLIPGLVMAGCGYSTKSTLPSNLKTIHILPFKNSIDFTEGTARNVYLPLLEVDARNAVVDRFLFNGSLKIAEQQTADLILKGELTGYERSVLRYTDNEDVEEYRIHVTVSLELFNTQKNMVSWTESGFTGEATYFVTGPQISSEESAVKEALRDLARRIVERTVEDW